LSVTDQSNGVLVGFDFRNRAPGHNKASQRNAASSQASRPQPVFDSEYSVFLDTLNAVRPHNTYLHEHGSIPIFFGHDQINKRFGPNSHSTL